MEVLITSNCPLSTVIPCRKMAGNTIQQIGNRPNAAPWRTEAARIGAGVPNSSRATRTAATKAATAAFHAGARRTAMRKNNNAIGAAAAAAEAHRLPPTPR